MNEIVLGCEPLRLDTGEFNYNIFSTVRFEVWNLQSFFFLYIKFYYIKTHIIKKYICKNSDTNILKIEVIMGLSQIDYYVAISYDILITME